MDIDRWLDKAGPGSTKWASRLVLITFATMIPILIVVLLLVRATYYFDGYTIATLIGFAGGIIAWIVWTIKD